MNDIKAKLRGALYSLTIIFNTVMGALLVGLPAAQDSLPQLQAYLPADKYQMLMAVVIVGNILLRFRTSKPLDQK